MTGGIEDRARFDFVRYANCWEDPALLIEALRAGPGRRILSIASGGDNAFALLAAGADVVAADLSAAQLACVELKAAAIRALERDALLEFLGIRPSGARTTAYRALRSGLSETARGFWDARPEQIGRGILHCGKFERYFHAFRTRVLPLLHGRATVHRLLEARPAPERRLFYDRVWNGLRWRLFFRIFFSRAVMGRLGRDPEFFRYVEGSVGARILRRAEYALTELPTDTNPYLDYILTGNFTRTLPDYLLPDTLPAVRARLDRLVLFEGPVEAAAAAHAAGGFDGFNLSDIFEYLPLPTCEAVYASLLGTARPGARFAYWNMLAPRRLAACFPGRVRALHGIGEALARRDRAFFYQAFVVDETPSREEATS